MTYRFGIPVAVAGTAPHLPGDARNRFPRVPSDERGPKERSR